MSNKINLLANKWLLGGIIWILAVIVLCFIWYRHSITPYEKSVEDTYEIIRQRESTQKVNTKNITEDITNTSTKFQNSNETINSDNKKVEQDNNDLNDRNSTIQTETLEKLKVSSNSFGPYPKVPSDYPLRSPIWLRNPKRVQDSTAHPFEIMDRVLIKLWNQGRKDITGASYNTSNGKVYPHFTNTAYIQYGKKIILPDGNVYKPIERVTGGPDIGAYHNQIRNGNTPAHISLLDYDSAGIDPYTFLIE